MQHLGRSLPRRLPLSHLLFQLVAIQNRKLSQSFQHHNFLNHKKKIELMLVLVLISTKNTASLAGKLKSPEQRMRFLNS